MSDELNEGAPQQRSPRLGRKTIVVIAVLVLVAAGLVAAGIVMSRDRGAEETATLQGTVLQGPMPTVQAGDSSYEPVSATVVVTRASDGKQVATTRSDAEGHYSVELPPGDYLVTAHLDEPGGPDIRPIPVTLRSGETSTVSLRLDSGIRF